MAEFNGLNGTIMLNTGREGLPVGTVDGQAYGYAAGTRLGVRLNVRIERLERRETYETVEHEQVTRPLGMSVTTDVWRPDGQDIVTGGATREPLREVAAHGTPSRFWDADKLYRMAALGDRWHLNDMQAACLHQTVVYEEEPYHRPSLDLTLPCPVTGYRYGTGWLVNPLPQILLTNLLGVLLAGPIANHNVYVHPEMNGYL
jgi:hypothetical protein